MSHVAALPGSTPRLPAEITGFVGRRQDRARVRQLLSEARLVTLTGFGGIGKTRLALRVAGEVSRAYRDGVWWIPLGDLGDPGLLAEATAAALGVHDQYARLDFTELARRLQSREALLVLDNCEHLIEDCAVMATTLLTGCPGIHILATSREALRVDGEAVYAVAPLSVPQHPAAAPENTPEYESFRLLVDRAAQVAPGSFLSGEHDSTILSICRHLDGIPLALELAAVRLRAMSPTELLDRLREHWELLDVGTRGAPERHRTMSACVEWSYGLCTQAERDLWAILSVFTGGMDMDAIRYVAARQLPELTPVMTVRLVQSLVDKSILTREAGNDRSRYRMLEVLRRFGSATLDTAGRTHDARTAHRDWCADLVTRFDDDWMSSGQVAALSRVRREEANLRHALAFCSTEESEGEIGLAMAASLRKYAVALGWFSEGRVWLHRLLPRVAADSPVRLRGLRAACWLAAMQGDRQAAASLLVECQALARELQSPDAAALADQATGLCHMYTDDLAQAVERLTGAREGFRATGATREEAETLVLLGMAYGFAGALEKARQVHQDCQSLCTAHGESIYRSHSLWNAGLVAWRQGEGATAIELVREALGLKRQTGERLGVALCLEALAWIAADRAPADSAKLLGAVRSVWDSMGTSGTTMPGLLRYRAHCRETLGRLLSTDAFDKAFSAGAQLDAASATALAMGETESRVQAQRRSASESSDGPKLTKREREIAGLVAAGLSNREIASQLVISPRTAETHVEHILIKLGFTSRTQIGVWISARETGPEGP